MKLSARKKLNTEGHVEITQRSFGATRPYRVSTCYIVYIYRNRFKEKHVCEVVSIKKQQEYIKKETT